MTTINSSEAYHFLIDTDLLNLVKAAIELEAACLDEARYSEKRKALENRLYDLYQEIGWSVVYDIQGIPF